MRLHITLDEETVQELDRRAGRGGRSAFIARAIRRELDDARRWELIESAVGSIPAYGHDWDDDPAAWVAEQRRLDPRRVG